MPGAQFIDGNSQCATIDSSVSGTIIQQIRIQIPRVNSQLSTLRLDAAVQHCIP